jgi:hypothetical protein
MANLTPADLESVPRSQVDPANDLALVWDASAAVLKSIAAGNFLAPGVINAVAAHGIDNTGATPVSDALNALLAEVEAAGGGVVFLSPGVYRNDKLIRVGNNTTLLGAGRGATIIRSEPAVVPFNGAYGSVGCIGKSRASIRSLTLDHATNSTSTNGICLWPSEPDTATGTPSSFCSIVDCEILGFNSHQYLIWNRRSNDSIIAFNYVDGGVASYAPGSQQEGIEIFGGRRVIVIGNHVSNIGSTGIFPWNAPDFADHTLQDILISDNIVSRCRDGIVGGAQYGPVNGAQILDRVHIRNNTVQSCWRYGIGLAYSGGGEPPGTVVMRDVVVDGNTVNCEVLPTWPLAFSFAIGSTSATSEGCLISNNIFGGGGEPNNPTSGTVQISRAHNTAWRGNRIRNVNGAAHGIYIDNSNNVIFENNDLWGAGLSAMVLDHVDGSRFVGNRFANWNTSGTGQNAIPMYSVTNTVLSGNSFLNPQPAATYCIQGSDTESSGLYVSNNFVQFAGPIGAAEPVRAPGENTNRGEASMPVGESYVVIENSRMQTRVPVQVTQVAGYPSAFVVSRGVGYFAIARVDKRSEAHYNWQIGD